MLTLQNIPESPQLLHNICHCESELLVDYVIHVPKSAKNMATLQEK